MKQGKFIGTNGVEKWYKNGRLHREDGPAFINGYIKEWWLNGEPHRDNGPAVDDGKGNLEYWVHGKLHRENGPAIISSYGMYLWYFNDKEIRCTSQKEFERIIKLRLFL
jgi:hypothetical protein